MLDDVDELPVVQLCSTGTDDSAVVSLLCGCASGQYRLVVTSDAQHVDGYRRHHAEVANMSLHAMHEVSTSHTQTRRTPCERLHSLHHR